ncbi:MazG-like family protein [Thermoanaerobacterium sp. RBIITD]|uniref:MazG-like family protein n=1 Tax=Thermoanaerobacterium sp. RBIITD TaxID=1550240 RepID=UPI000BB8094B|nr:MazG-like family protein [Thermoanaerobacterium sp. RBIITD]SNX53756.1 MazG-like family protein [Thermoanaerobacterium sp. RBIITD]
MENNFDIAKNIKIIENLKIELLNRTASLFNAFNQDDMSLELIDDICHIIITGYLLGNKLGYDYKELDEEIEKRIRLIPAEIKEEDTLNYKELITYLRKR